MHLPGLAVNFVAGDAAAQLAATGEADWKDSLQYGLTRAATGGILGTGSTKNLSWKQKTARHGAAGSTSEVIRQLFEDPTESYQVSRTSYRRTRTPVEEMVPVMYPGKGMSCNGSSPLEMGIGFYKIRGYRYEQEPFTETVTVSGREPSLMERVAAVAVEGIGAAVFGGLLPETVRRNDAALGAVSGSVRRGNGSIIPWSSKTVSIAAKRLENGDKIVTVANRSQAEELFLGIYQGEGYANVSGMDAMDVKNLMGNKGNTYHWDDVFGEDGYLMGHGPGNPDATVPHLQIHPEKGKIIRIFFEEW